MDRNEILRKLEENRETIRGFGVRRLGIFGSYARGEQSEASDMDFLVEFEKKTFDNYMDLTLPRFRKVKGLSPFNMFPGAKPMVTNPPTVLEGAGPSGGPTGEKPVICFSCACL